MPAGETLQAFAKTGALMAIHLSIHKLQEVVDTLSPHYGEDCPAAVVYRASWPEQTILRAPLATLAARLDPAIDRSAVIFVGPGLATEDFANSRLYAIDYTRRYRQGTHEADSGEGDPT